jgi:cation diffusion facilitator CzcD-associated flavoprotein CzcO
VSDAPEHVDVLIIGAGLSGIGAAAHLTRELPGTSYAVLEARAASGGTWDLFRYPGVRSDSDMYTMGYAFRPWTGNEALADGDRILDYLRETAREYGVDRRIRYRHRVVRCVWSSSDARWTVVAEHDGREVELTAGFVWSCAGYYDYEQPHRPELAGEEEFAGRVVHPQFWPADLDWDGRRVAVIGSGATAVTVVPTLAERAAHVTMVQRSPSYVISLGRRDPVARAVRWLPANLARQLVRWKNILVAAAFFRLSRLRPAYVRGLVRRSAVRQLPEGYDVDTHFTPAYDPWDQRMCFARDGDFYRSIRHGRAEVVTGTVERFDRTGLVLADGRHLDADLVVTATGLRLAPFAFELVVDGRHVDPSAEMAYRAMMLTGVPNFVYAVGYTNASWTLKVDLVADYTCRLLAHLRDSGYRQVVPVRDASVAERPFMELTSGYIQRAAATLPRQGDREPWRLRQSYLRDRRTIRRAPLEDGVLRFS